jgi:hypothetical protein
VRWALRGCLAVAAVLGPPIAACANGDSSATTDDGGGGQTDDSMPTDDGSPPGDDGSPPGDDGGPQGDGGSCMSAGDCMLPPNVMTANCTNGACGIGTCTPGWYDVNGVYSDGCECQGVANGTACATATTVPPLNIGGMTTATGNLPGMMDENWFQISFSGNTNTAYHPHVTLTTNPNSEFKFDVSSDCNKTALICAVEANGPSTGLTEWEVKYTAGDGGPTFKPIPAVGNNGTILVRVFRPTGMPTCDNFVLTISN